MVNSYYYYGNEYLPRTAFDREKGFWISTAASGAIMSLLPLCCKPFEKHLAKEHLENHLYKDAFEKSIQISGLDEKGVKIINAQNLFIKTPESEGKNAFYNLKNREIVINTDKISIAGFHEAGHALNDLTGKIGKLLSKLRWPGRILAGFMGYIALFARSKPSDAPENIFDKIKDNCGKIAFVCMLPTVFEEGLASYKGIKLARKSALTDGLISNMKKLYGKALLTYIGHAVLTGCAVGVASMIMDRYSRPKKLN